MAQSRELDAASESGVLENRLAYEFPGEPFTSGDERGNPMAGLAE